LIKIISSVIKNQAKNHAFLKLSMICMTHLISMLISFTYY